MTTPDPAAAQLQQLLNDLIGQEPDPGILAAADQHQKASMEGAHALLAIMIQGHVQEEFGATGAAQRCTVSVVQRLMDLSHMELEFVAVALTTIITRAMYHQWGGTWADVARAMLDPSMPLLPGLPAPQPTPETDAR